MRIRQLGCRYVCTHSPNGDLRYFRATRFSSLRLFWIFRNFADLHQHVLSPRQLRLILNCEAIDENARINRGELIGTIELSAGPTKGFEPKPRVRVIAAQPAAQTQLRGRSFAISAIATAATVASVVVAFSVTEIDWARPVTAASSNSKQTAVSLLPRVNEALNSRRTEAPQSQFERPFTLNSGHSAVMPNPKPIWEANEIADFNSSAPAEVRNSVALQRAVLKFSSSHESPTIADSPIADLSLARRSSPRHESVKLRHSQIVADVLPPAGPPESHPISGDFSSVIRDTEVMLRAIVSPEGRVKAVKIVRGDTELGREAARVVNSWRYAPHASGTDGESRILFKFGSDVTTVSFLNSRPGLQNR